MFGFRLGLATGIRLSRLLFGLVFGFRLGFTTGICFSRLLFGLLTFFLQPLPGQCLSLLQAGRFFGFANFCLPLFVFSQAPHVLLPYPFFGQSLTLGLLLCFLFSLTLLLNSGLVATLLLAAGITSGLYRLVADQGCLYDIGLRYFWNLVGRIKMHPKQQDQNQMERDGQTQGNALMTGEARGHSSAGRVINPTLGTPAFLRAAMMATTLP